MYFISAIVIPQSTYCFTTKLFGVLQQCYLRFIIHVCCV